MGWFRSDSLEELVGLDLSYMGNNAASSVGQAASDGFSDAGADDATDFDGQSQTKRNTRSFTNAKDSDDESWVDDSKKEQPRRKK